MIQRYTLDDDLRDVDENGDWVTYADHDSDKAEAVRKAKVEAITEFCTMLRAEINDDDVASEYLLERISGVYLENLRGKK